MNDFRFEAQLALTVTNPTVRSLARAHAEGRLELRPPFQRNLVWNQDQKSYLIDSILRHFPIPEIYVQLGDAPGGLADVIIIVDGQQRVSSCIEFLTDRLRLSGHGLDPAWQGRTFSELDPALQQRFARYKFIMRELPALELAEIREIFTRLNRVVEPLMPQELRHAAYAGTAYLEMVEAIGSHPGLQRLGVFSAKDFRRRGNDELIAEITHAHINQAFPNKKEGLEEGFRYYAKNGLPEPTRDDVIARFGRVFALLEQVERSIRSSRFRNKSDFYSLAVLLLKRAESLPLPDEGVERLGAALGRLSDRITEYRREELAGEDIEATTPDDELALKYMRAVQRAASDRLSRVRRDDVLGEWIGAALATGVPSPLTDEDKAWLEVLEEAEEDAAAEVEAERKHLAEVLMEREGAAEE